MEFIEKERIIKHFEEELKKLEERIGTLSAKTLSRMKTDGHKILKSEDADSISTESDPDVKCLEFLNLQVEAIRENIKNLKAGTCILCEECGNEIPWGRLEAAPFARLCVLCKSKEEKAEKIKSLGRRPTRNAVVDMCITRR